MTACAARMPAPKYVLEEQEDMRSSTLANVGINGEDKVSSNARRCWRRSTIANVGINGEDKVVKQCATVLSAASTTITYWSNLNTCSRTAAETRV
jgi:hypothetical protein